MISSASMIFSKECLFEVVWAVRNNKVDVFKGEFSVLIVCYFGGPHGNVVPAKQ